MKNVNLSLKPVRGKKLLLKVKTTINYDNLKKRATEKYSHHHQSFCGLEEYVFFYPDGKEALFLPGITSARFKLDSCKEELGKLYSQTVVYLGCTSEFDNVSCGANEFLDPKLSLPGIVTNHIDKIYESEMPVIIDDQEREPNIPVIDLEKEVFDLYSYNYNQTLVTSNVDISFSSVTTNSSSHEDLTTKLKTIRRNFIGNVYDLDQIDVDGIYELKIKRIEIWEHTNIKLKRQLKSSLKAICIVFIGEPAFDAGGLLREFFTLYFNAAARNIMQGTSGSFALLHDIKKLNNGDFERFALLMALALIYGCPVPRNIQELLVCVIMIYQVDTFYVITFMPKYGKKMIFHAQKRPEVSAYLAPYIEK